MRIAFDGEKAIRNKAGLGNYSRFAIRCLAQRYPDCLFDIYLVDRDTDTTFLSSLKAYPNVNLHYPEHSFFRFLPWLWRRFGIPEELEKSGVDIYHGLTNYLPRNIRKAKGVKSLVTVHDLIFLAFPGPYSWIGRHIRNSLTRSACELSDRIISVSRCTASDIVKYYFIPKDKISVVYQGCDSSFRKGCSASFKDLVRQRFTLPKRYVLSVGTIEERKNIVQMIRALAYLPDLHFVLVGRKTRYIYDVKIAAEEAGVSGRVHILSGVGPKELPAIYQMADVFVMPSRYEGFGIPILEALSCGVPAVAASGSCLEEAGGEAALYVDPDDVPGLADAVKRVLSDSALRSSMVEKGYEQASRFTEKAFAEHLMSIYESLLGK